MTAQRVRGFEGSSAPASERFPLMRSEVTNRCGASRWNNCSAWPSLAARLLPFPALMVAVLASAVCAVRQQSTNATFLPRIVNGLTTQCHAFDSRGDSKVTVDELVRGVDNALSGCGTAGLRR